MKTNNMIRGNMIEKGEFAHKKTCRICGSKKLYKFLSLGPTPLANSLLNESKLTKPELYYPLDVYFCDNCNLIQLSDVVPPDIMFRDYMYVTGASKPMELHFTRLVKDIMEKFDTCKDSLVIDIGSNDGTLLQCFSKFDLRTLGIEPASNIAKISEKKGIPTVNDFFNEKCAIKVQKDHGKAEIITATNVFAHVDDLETILRGIIHLLSDNGIFVIEVPYLKNLLENIEFDTIYHEHLSYFAVRPLVYLFEKFGMRIVDIKNIPSHGGSIRVFVKKSSKDHSQNVIRMLSAEKKARLDSIETYMRFAEKVALIKEELVKLLKKLKDKNEKITGYGATAKGNTLLNYCQIGTGLLDYITDTTPFKQGRYTPGMHIPILPEERFHEDPPDYALLLAWNYADAILQKEKKYIENGGRFILPTPKPRVIPK